MPEPINYADLESAYRECLNAGAEPDSIPQLGVFNLGNLRYLSNEHPEWELREDIRLMISGELSDSSCIMIGPDFVKVVD
jgi:hypothetical protein